MLYTDTIASLRTRSEVRGSLAKEIDDLIGAPPQAGLPAELRELPTGSDREVVQTSLRLDKSFGALSVADAKSANATLGRQVRDLYTKALQRMKELPPDARETLHAKASPSTSVTRHAPVRRK